MDTGDDGRDHIDITIGNHGQAEDRRGERQGSENGAKSGAHSQKLDQRLNVVRLYRHEGAHHHARARPREEHYHLDQRKYCSLTWNAAYQTKTIGELRTSPLFQGTTDAVKTDGDQRRNEDEA